MTDPSQSTADKKSPRRWLRRVWGWLPTLAVLSLVAVIFVLAGRIQTQGEVIKARRAAEMGTGQIPTNVITMELVPRPLKARISLPGVVRPWISLNLVAEVGGIVVEKRVTEGALVKKGDVIARIDSRDYRNALASAKAAYDLSVATQKRLTALFDDKIATQSQVDDIAAQVRTNKAAMDTAALNLERCSIRAPMNGVVNRLHVDPGHYLAAGDPVAEILQMDRVKVVVGIPESDVDAIRQRERFHVTIDALGGRSFEGTRHHLTRTSDNFARLYNLEIAVDNTDNKILPDMFARVEVVKKEVPDGLAVPLFALITQNKLQAVYVVEDDTAQLRPWRWGSRTAGRWKLPRALRPETGWWSWGSAASTMAKWST
jgi:membrane fusion protein (multidrug efflux system)